MNIHQRQTAAQSRLFYVDDHFVLSANFLSARNLVHIHRARHGEQSSPEPETGSPVGKGTPRPSSSEASRKANIVHHKTRPGTKQQKWSHYTTKLVTSAAIHQSMMEIKDGSAVPRTAAVRPECPMTARYVIDRR